MIEDDKLHDVSFYLRKEVEYNAKARATSDPKIKSAYEAAEREYAYRALLLKETEKVRPPQ